MIEAERQTPKETTPKTPFQIHYSAALDLLEKGELDKAAKRFQHAAIASPEQFSEAAIEIGRIGDPHLALGCLSELLRISKSAPLLSATWCAIGNIYSNAGNRDEAMECFVKSWDLNQHPGSASNRALIHLWNGEVSDAERWIKRSLDLNPWIPEAQFVQSMITLVGRGHYRTGFKQYECRWRSREGGLRKLPSDKPEWPGPSHNKGRLLVYGEQGMGDTILSLRYARLIKELGLKQIWVVQPPVKRLAESMGIIDEVKNPGEEFHDYDFHIPAISLIRCFETSLENIPPSDWGAGKGYLPTVWLDRILHDPHYNNRPKRIGICWQGSSVNRNNPIRSAPLHEWKPIFALGDAFEFHSFQVDNWQDAIPYSEINISPVPSDWLETAQRVERMDLVISVDTALVHLCGAMGIPCWVPLHCRPYFVYPITRKRCPWYPSLTLFKQTKEHEWKPVFERIAEHLRTINQAPAV